MADSVICKYALKLLSQVTLDLGIDGITNPVVDHQISVFDGILDADTTPPVTLAWKDQRSLAGGADTLDLTALVRANLPDLDLTGLKVQFVHIKAATANANPMTFSDGATNGYHLFGDASGQVTLLPGQQVLLLGNDQLPDVAGGAKDIDVAGTGTETYDIHIVAG